MGSYSTRLGVIGRLSQEMSQRGLILHSAEDSALDGRTVQIQGKSRINFGSCSYLGLELDPRVQQGAIDAIVRYGTQFSSSRMYLSAPLYRELEDLLDRIFEGHTLVTPNTTLAHLSALPLLIGEDDVALLDHQVHATVRMGADRARLHGARLEVVPHNDMDRLESRLRELRGSHRHVWYLADGVYSMRGDFAPMRELAVLLELYPQLHLYIDDAHGMGWCGRHGRGYALSQLASHPRMVVATSLNKCFGAGGGALVFADEADRDHVTRLAGPVMFTGPIQPPSLGAAIASARIHLSPEISVLQRRLQERVRCFNRRADRRGAPRVGSEEAPTRFVAMGLPAVAANMTAHLFERGFWTNVATFPAVVARESGVRCALNLHHTVEDLHDLVDTIAAHLPVALEREGSSVDELRRLFQLEAPVELEAPAEEGPRRRCPPLRAVPSLRVQYERSIEMLDAAEWNRLLGGRGVFTASGLRLLESAFRGNEKPEDNWGFHYLVVRERSGRPVLATFFTDALWKEDLLASAEVSRRIEKVRREDPYFLTGRVLSMGSLLSEGDHLYLDRGAAWQDAIALMLREADRLAEACGARRVVLRDLPADDPELDRLLGDRGFLKAPLPDSMVLEIDWNSDEEYLRKLNRDFRRHQKRHVLRWDRAYSVEVLERSGRILTEAEWSHLHGLYRNVRERNLELNTFEIPRRFFENTMQHPDWELLVFRLEPALGGDADGRPAGLLAAHVGPDHYTPLVVGLDYRWVRSHGLYRRCILECVRRAQAHGSRRVFFGLGAELEKRRFGATRRPHVIYARSDDHLQTDVLTQFEADAALARQFETRRLREARSA